MDVGIRVARQLGIGRGDAQKYMDLYFERYPGVKRYMEETRRQARETGFVKRSSDGACTCRRSSRETSACANMPSAARSTRHARTVPTSSSAP